MPYRIPPIHCLTAFEAVARLRAVVQAADELCVTASAVSHRLRQLEDTLGVKLFNRSGGNNNEFTLTVAGRQYLEKVRQGLEVLNQTPAQGETSTEKKPLRLAVTPTYARQILLPRLPEFNAAYPDIELVMQVSIPFLDVKAEECDVEIRYGAGPYAGLVTHRLLEDQVTPVCSPTFLQQYGPIATPAALANVPVLRSPLAPWREWFVAAGLDWPEPREGAQFNDIGLLMDAAAHGQGVALARVRLSHQWLERGQLVPLFPLTAHSAYGHYLTYKQEVAERWECASFIDWANKVLPAA